jgi:hypothetical protein
VFAENVRKDKGGEEGDEDEDNALDTLTEGN